MTGPYVLSPEEVQENFREQLLALKSSCAAYDSGQHWEAKRLATAVYVICHDPPTSRKGGLIKSLLSQLKAKEKTRFLTTAKPFSADRIPSLPLVSMYCAEGQPWIFRADLDVVRTHWRHVSFSKWWEETVFLTPEGKQLSRKNLIFAMRSQDNGAHSDEEIRNNEYGLLRRFNDYRLTRQKPATDTGWISIRPERKRVEDIPDDEEPVPLAHLATVRQIAFEVLQSTAHLLNMPENGRGTEPTAGNVTISGLNLRY